MTDRKVILKTQSLENFPEDLQKAFHFLSIFSNYFLVGSAQYKNFIYSSDYDLNEKFKCKDTTSVLTQLYHSFKEKFQHAKKDPDIFITDFKLGEDEDKEPLRWNYDEVIQGFKTQGNIRYSFIQCLQMKATMKLDTIVFINDTATEITDNYFLSIDHKPTLNDSTKKETLHMLRDDYNEQIVTGNYFKAIKRLFSMQALQGNPSKRLVELFNSDLGRLYKCISDLKILVELLDQTFKPVPLERVKSTLQIIKFAASNIVSVNVQFVNGVIDKLCS